MKISSFFSILFLVLSITGCDRESFSGLSGDVQFYVPNVITLTSLGNNIFYPYVYSDTPELEYHIDVMEIFDRYGNLMSKAEQFPINNFTFGWDGTFKGEQVESGDY